MRIPPLVAKLETTNAPKPRRTTSGCSDANTSLSRRHALPATGVRRGGIRGFTEATARSIMLQMKRLSARGKPDRELTDVAGDLSVRPKYAPIPGLGVVVLERRHAPEWSVPGWFEADFLQWPNIKYGMAPRRKPPRQVRAKLRTSRRPRWRTQRSLLL